MYWCSYLACPITSKVKGYPFEVGIPGGLTIHGAILTDQLRSVDWRSGNLKIVCKVPEETVQECLEKINTFITLD
ncbi:type II toxin-antitoxin system PemK/MazF family toxin [Bacillaceae bacterium Marseille-Q3522]|nr:type II toxin-antitoxin system PemK/MazF family toxin [Bacillaceae bacterium Marseille-Q3522]